MRGKLMLKKAIFAVKLSLFPICCWPLSKDATKLRMICVELYHYLCIILAICLKLSLIYAIINHLDDFIILVELILFLSSVIHSIGNFIFHKINRHRIQYITFEVIHFSELIKPHEDIIIQQYIDKCHIFYGTCLVTFYLATVVTVTIVPIIMDQPFPTLAEYPFNVYYQPLRTIIYMHQVVVGIHVTGQLCTNVFMALLLWFASARFDILTEELRKTTDIYHLAKCIRKHQYLIEYANEIVIATRPFALTTVCCSTVCMIIVCLLILTNQSLVLITKYATFGMSCLSEVFMYTWPAEHLIFTSQNVAQAAFDTPWYDQSSQVRKCIQIIIRKSQKPITVAIACIMPTLSLNYFASYCSTIVSFFTTFRAFLNDAK
ncbi:odorant receptor 13a-like [Anoplolepis gracilipes]|uniref:odorant receptor 13a-like n=1 Tax=Anoplolepis gracilipes TaxID=354296 RepID=UPI003BA3D759